MKRNNVLSFNNGHIVQYWHNTDSLAYNIGIRTLYDLYIVKVYIDLTTFQIETKLLVRPAKAQGILDNLSGRYKFLL